MQIQSPLSNLADVLVKIGSSSKQYQDTLEKNEAATRAVLVDPVLRVLGWDTANTNMVEVEKTLDRSRVDYALYDSNGEVRVIVEAKSLGSNLEHSTILMSLVNYAFTFKLQDVFLTDGMIWHHYTNFQPGNIKVEKHINILSDDVVSCAAYLVQRLDAAKYWPEEQTIDLLAEQVANLENVVASLRQEVTHLKSAISQMSNSPAKVAQNVEIIPTQPTQPDLIYIELENLYDLAFKKPNMLRLPNGDEIPVRQWKEILRECCKFALKSNLNIQIPFPDRVGKKVTLLSLVKPAQGISHITEEYNGQTIYIYSNYDSYNCIANAIHILKQVPKINFSHSPAVSISPINE